MYHPNLSLIVELYETVSAGNGFRISNQVVTWFFLMKIFNPLTPVPQNGQTHSNNSSAEKLKGLVRNPFWRKEIHTNEKAVEKSRTFIL